MTGGIMKEIKVSSFAPAAIVLIIVMAGFSSCSSFEAPAEAGSAMSGKSSQQLLYQQSVEQSKLIQPPDAGSLGGASDPNWGPLPLNIRRWESKR
jgi:hypothetical protein